VSDFGAVHAMPLALPSERDVTRLATRILRYLEATLGRMAVVTLRAPSTVLSRLPASALLYIPADAPGALTVQLPHDAHAGQIVGAVNRGPGALTIAADPAGSIEGGSSYALPAGKAARFWASAVSPAAWVLLDRIP
jgi:hypothetical protein